ncbi:subunit F of vacuolar ATP synthase [Chloropicon primus]|uniref:V-type proton ATPase subunit F n=1 Tax=Chloropicon primus TaxID=1764295 RepID=A0A5B8N084_9CHLO|nr:subunit F of vacuolar ATP synthase [Chloropicon primus]UPR04375.1 subunit F of vacuolar ATP synthase [Chloropicon primus]|eukprot:QDZ25170.1 subunit F of vacuolar ATP synthase [Chloropicon primus]
MAQQQQGTSAQDGSLIALIGDEDTVTGFLLAGVGHKDFRQNTNYLIVDSKTTTKEIESTFLSFSQRTDVAIIIIAQNVANEIRHLIERYDKAIPAILEIPAKDQPYDPSQDTMLTRVKTLLGIQ